MRLVEWVLIISFFLLLVFAVYLLWTFYICDYQTCMLFVRPEEEWTKGSKGYTQAIVNDFFNDGIWCFPYIAAAISTPLCLWFLEAPINVYNFSLLFFVSFAVNYFILAFLSHHYVKFYTTYMRGYISDNCSDTVSPGYSEEFVDYNYSEIYPLDDKKIPIIPMYTGISFSNLKFP